MTLNLIGGGEGVSEWIWQQQLQYASRLAGGPVYHYGTAINDKPVHSHVTAEGF